MPGSFPPWLPGTAFSMNEAEPLVCSARGCTRPAEFKLLWNNPKIHPSDRRKTWLACAAHRVTLTEFLSARGMFREDEAIATDSGEAAAAEPPNP